MMASTAAASLILITLVVGGVAALAAVVDHFAKRPPASTPASPVYVPARGRPATPLPRRPAVRHWCPECDCTDHTVMVWTTFNRYICRDCMNNGGYAHPGSPVAKRERLIAGES
jgi:hypothetical protein